MFYKSLLTLSFFFICLATQAKSTQTKTTQFRVVDYQNYENSHDCQHKTLDDFGFAYRVDCTDAKNQSRRFNVHLSYKWQSTESLSVTELLFWVTEPATGLEVGSSQWMRLEGSSKPLRLTHRQFVDRGNRALEILIQN